MGNIEQAWNNHAAILIGGGPSLRDFDWAGLARYVTATKTKTIVVNRAILDFPIADIWFSEDYRVIPLWADKVEWRNFRGIKILHALDDERCLQVVSQNDSSVVLIPKVDEKKWSDSLDDGLSYSSNSMIGALNLADIFGADPIYLLGVDCKSDNGRECNYHRDYEDAGIPRTGDHQYESFKSDFEHWAAIHLKRKGKTVINLGPDSALDCWPKMDMMELYI